MAQRNYLQSVVAGAVAGLAAFIAWVVVPVAIMLAKLVLTNLLSGGNDGMVMVVGALGSRVGWPALVFAGAAFAVTFLVAVRRQRGDLSAASS